MAVAEQVILAPDELPGTLEEFLEPQTDEDGRLIDPSADEMPHIDPTLAPRLARRRARLARQMADLDARYQVEADALRVWRDAQAARLQSEADRLDLTLRAVLAHERTIDPKRKSLTLPYGVTVQARKVPASIKRDSKVAPTNALMEWLGSDDQRYFESKPVLRWEALKADLAVLEGRVIFTETGETVPPECGVTFEPEHESETVKVDLGAGA